MNDRVCVLFCASTDGTVKMKSSNILFSHYVNFLVVVKLQLLLFLALVDNSFTLYPEIVM